MEIVLTNENDQTGRVLDLTSETLIIKSYQAILLRIF